MKSKMLTYGPVLSRKRREIINTAPNDMQVDTGKVVEPERDQRACDTYGGVLEAARGNPSVGEVTFQTPAKDTSTDLKIKF